jgi:hypothetical protein
MLKFFQQMGFGATAPDAKGSSTRAEDLGGYELVLVFFLLITVIYCGFQTSIFLKGN